MEKFTKEIDLSMATNEQHFNAEQLLNEIVPVLDDYFAGKIFFLDGKIECEFPNGQKFEITAVEKK